MISYFVILIVFVDRTQAQGSSANLFYYLEAGEYEQDEVVFHPGKFSIRLKTVQVHSSDVFETVCPD